ncbi:hypothetical protein GCM10028803_41440 [Larkinella knui]|uniref:Lipocalin-like domain-containing protein n=1 Tax=Larkinella knui TaxID=2025310 RepID=A0A3P1CNB7_9BACT|nr:hypothetical protein [Larkinella knui]RRB14775.1 hypothetical protein EHT87_09400 [Larkinella knui]
MKRLLYLISVVVFAAGLSSCNKDDDPAPDPVVGKWASDRVRISGLPAPFTASNGQELDALTQFGISTSFEIKSDKTFTETDRSGGTVVDFEGTWVYTGTELTKNYSDGDIIKLTYDDTKKQLLSETIAVQDSLVNPTTSKRQLVSFTLQLVYKHP